MHPTRLLPGHRLTVPVVLLVLLGFAATLPAEQESLDLKSAIRIALMDPKPSAEELPKLLEQVAASPDDTEARMRLINYYRPFEPQDRRSWEAHLVWLLEKYPDEVETAHLTRSLAALPHGEALELTKRLWLEQAERYPNDPKVQANAATFFSLHDHELAQALMEKAKALEPKNPQWSRQLAQLHQLGAMGQDKDAVGDAARAALKELEGALGNMSDEERQANLPQLAKYAFDAGAYGKARNWAEEMLRLAAGPPSWNLGNLQHHGHLILGRLALHKGDVAKAKDHLLDAARTDGSPQLNSFGPNMKLAEALLVEGERETVLEYLALCGDFWDMGKDRLKEWKKTINNGGMPNFGGNLLY